MLDGLIGQGFEPDAARSRQALVERADAAFRTMSGAAPLWRWIVPGRLEVLGKHTDYAGGRSLIAAVPRGFAVVAGARADGMVRALDARHGELTTVDPTGTARPRRGWATYVGTVIQRLSRNFPGAHLGADIAFASDLPRSAGVSSSSALLVGVATTLVRRGALTVRDEWRHAIQSPLDLAGYFGCIENGRTFRTLSGTRGVGTEGGSEDHTAILLGCAGTLRQFSYAPVRHEDDVQMPAGWRFVLASSGVHADKAGTVRDRYNRAARIVAALLAIWNERADKPVVSLGAAFAGDTSAPDRLRAWIQQASGTEFSADDLERRLEHFLREDGRVPDVAAAFRHADFESLGDLAAASQRDAEELLGNQVPETSALVKAALDEGALAACSFGAGFGGSAWAILSAGDADRFGDAWIARYRSQFPERTRVEWFSAIPAPAMIEVGA